MDSLKEYLKANIKIDQNGCWIWQGKTYEGYGQTSARDSGIPHSTGIAHRFAFVEWNGPIPEGLLICHKCNVKACINPEHLYAGTHADNSRDASLNGTNGLKGSRNHNAKLNERHVREIRRLAKCGLTHRAIAERFVVSVSMVDYICSRKSWKHIQ